MHIIFNLLKMKDKKFEGHLRKRHMTEEQIIRTTVNFLSDKKDEYADIFILLFL